MSAHYSISEVANILDAEILGHGEDCEIQYLGYDSRTLDHPAQTLFFAIKSSRVDGHTYIRECYQKGVRAFAISDKTSWIQLPAEIEANASFLLVKDTVQALQELAANHRSRFDIPVIGIT